MALFVECQMCVKAATRDQIIRQIFESNYLTEIFDAKVDGKFPSNVFVHSVKKKIIKYHSCKFLTVDGSMAAAIIVIALDSEESERPRKRRKWSKEWFLQRGIIYGHASLLKELRIKEPDLALRFLFRSSVLKPVRSVFIFFFSSSRVPSGTCSLYFLRRT